MSAESSLAPCHRIVKAVDAVSVSETVTVSEELLRFSSPQPDGSSVSKRNISNTKSPLNLCPWMIPYLVITTPYALIPLLKKM
jgi:hypothetical protein